MVESPAVFSSRTLVSDNQILLDVIRMVGDVGSILFYSVRGTSVEYLLIAAINQPPLSFLSQPNID